jgi:probable phosphoglycerate mutase
MDSITNKNAKIIKTIHLIRHGQTDFNKQNIIQGSGINSDLNETGIKQAQLFHEAYQNESYHHIYTSTLNRAIQSVKPFISNGFKHTALNAFDEINWGIMEGQKSNPQNFLLYQSIIQKWQNGDLDTAVDNGETPLQMYERQKVGLKHIMQQEHEEKILICMHGRALRSFLCLLTNTPLNEMEKWQHHNLCLYELNFNGSNFDVIKSNDIQHLDMLTF